MLALNSTFRSVSYSHLNKLWQMDWEVNMTQITLMKLSVNSAITAFGLGTIKLMVAK